MESNHYIIYATHEEFMAVEEFLEKERAKKEKEERYKKARHAISSQIADAISEFGADEVKLMVRAILREF